ncbi:MAG: hypothetical protein QOE77_1239 [Blastocatellia bacterium]|jgi:hypothetical protein|nr:hypothetical protein [Blastocatellia bacterium]
MLIKPTTIEGIYRDGKVELKQAPAGMEEARVIVTFMPIGAVSLSERGIDETQAADLRTRLSAFAEDWDQPEMGAYDAL